MLDVTLNLPDSRGIGTSQHVMLAAKTHEHGLCWTPTFLESNPVQAELHVLHRDNGDSCDAIVSNALTFDLTGIKSAFQTGYPSQRYRDSAAGRTEHTLRVLSSADRTATMGSAWAVARDDVWVGGERGQVAHFDALPGAKKSSASSTR